MTITVSDIIAITALLISLILSYFQFFRNKCIVKANIYSLSSQPIINYILPIKLDIVFINHGNQKGIINDIFLVIKHSQPYGALTNTIKSRLLVMVNGNRRAYIPPSENIYFDIYPHNVIRKEYTFSIDTKYLLNKFDPVNGIESFFDELRKEIEMEIEIISIDHKAKNSFNNNICL